MSKPIIGVMGGAKATRKVAEMAQELGRLIAERGWTLLNGGRNVGVMAASARGAHQAGGIVIGILPDRTKSKASPDLDYIIATGMRDARNMINVLSSDVVIACKGSLGTLTEIALALMHDKTVILLDWELTDPIFHPYSTAKKLLFVTRPQEAIEHVARVLAEATKKREVSDE